VAGPEQKSRVLAREERRRVANRETRIRCFRRISPGVGTGILHGERGKRQQKRGSCARSRSIQGMSVRKRCSAPREPTRCCARIIALPFIGSISPSSSPGGDAKPRAFDAIGWIGDHELRLQATQQGRYGTSILPTAAVAQTAKDLVGTWSDISNVNVRQDGSRVDLFGPPRMVIVRSLGCDCR
jgi:hypothetical protein